MRIFQWIAITAMTLFFPISGLAVNLGAVDLNTAGDSAGIDISGSEGNLPILVGVFIKVILGFLSVLLFIYFVYAGILWTMARGDEKQVIKAKAIITNAVIGLIITLSANALVFFFIAEFPGADVILSQEAQSTFIATEVESVDLISNIGKFINVILNVLGVVLLLIFLYAGFLWMTAAGDGKQVEKAKTMMRNAVAGLIIILLSRAMARFVIDRLVDAEIAYSPQAIHSVVLT